MPAKRKSPKPPETAAGRLYLDASQLEYLVLRISKEVVRQLRSGKGQSRLPSESEPAQASGPDDRDASGLARIRDAMTYLSISRGTIWKLMKSGELPRIRFGRSVRIPWSAIIERAARKRRN
jgi:excisionase family DNA binding protein